MEPALLLRVFVTPTQINITKAGSISRGQMRDNLGDFSASTLTLNPLLVMRHRSFSGFDETEQGTGNREQGTGQVLGRDLNPAQHNRPKRTGLLTHWGVEGTNWQQILSPIHQPVRMIQTTVILTLIFPRIAFE